MNDIPEEIRLLSTIYEYRGYVLIPLALLWLAGAVHLLLRQRKSFYLWLLVVPLVLQGLHIGAAYCGWRYRMELRDRFGRTPEGYVNIDLMPPAIFSEYAKNYYHPRFRDLKAMVVSTAVFLPMLAFLGWLAFMSETIRRKNARSRIEHAGDGGSDSAPAPPEETPKK